MVGCSNPIEVFASFNNSFAIFTNLIAFFGSILRLKLLALQIKKLSPPKAVLTFIVPKFLVFRSTSILSAKHARLVNVTFFTFLFSQSAITFIKPPGASRVNEVLGSVSYTHLTLPTIYSV